MMKTFIMSALLLFFSMQGFSQKKMTMTISGGLGYGGHKVEPRIFDGIISSSIDLSAAWPITDWLQTFIAVEHDSRTYLYNERVTAVFGEIKHIPFSGGALGVRLQKKSFFISTAPYFAASLKKYEQQGIRHPIDLPYKRTVELGAQVQIACTPQLRKGIRGVFAVELKQNFKNYSYYDGTFYPINRNISFKLGLLKELSIRA